jgi:hypothetical protein
MLGGAMTVFASPASAAVPGLQIVTAQSASNSVSPKSATATCPANKRVIGAGAEINGGLGDVVIDDLRPGPTTVVATGDEVGSGITGNWQVRAYAICAFP